MVETGSDWLPGWDPDCEECREMAGHEGLTIAPLMEIRHIDGRHELWHSAKPLPDGGDDGEDHDPA